MKERKEKKEIRAINLKRAEKKTIKRGVKEKKEYSWRRRETEQ